MKNVVYRKKELTSRVGRAVSVREVSCDKESDTQVNKTFVYLVSRVDQIPQDIPAPEVFITKKIESEGRSEVYLFRVKGVVYMKQHRFIYRVLYSHGLTVHLQWKTHVLSSKPSALA